MAAELDGWGNEVVETPQEIEQVITTEGIDAPEGEPATALDESVEGEQPEEDPDAWRVRRFDEDPGAVHRHILELEEKSPAFKRALHSLAATRAERQYREQLVEATEAKEAAELRAKRAEKFAGDAYWGPKSLAEREAEFARNPRAEQSYENWKKVTREVAGPQPQPLPAWVKGVVSDARTLVDSVAPMLSQEDEEFFRAMINNPATYAQYQSAPHRLVLDLKESIDSVLLPNNNGAVQAVATPRTPATGTTGARTRMEQPAQLNPANQRIGQHAPDTTPRRGSSSGGERFTASEFRDLPVETLKELHKRHGTKTGQQLFRIVGVA